MSTATRSWRLLRGALGALSLALLAAAAEVRPPDARDSDVENTVQVDVPASVLDGYTGTYQFGSTGILTVTRAGNQLSAQLTGQPVAEIYPSAATEFFYKIVKAQISFVQDAQGQTTSLVLHQNGRNITMSRVDAVVAAQINTNIAAKVQSQSATPGSNAALRRLIAGHISGTPNYAEMSPELANAVREQLPRSTVLYKRLGALKSVDFKGVGNQGWDIYDVTFENGHAEYRIALSRDGIITGALMSMGP